MEYVRAFVIGGAICVIGQLLIDLTKLTPARIMVAYVTGGVLLGALGWYAPLVNFAGCGATVPLSGFGYLLSEGVKAAVKEKGILGVFTGGITAKEVDFGPGGETTITMRRLLRPDFKIETSGKVAWHVDK
mgnify:CR=1 FL=1